MSVNAIHFGNLYGVNAIKQAQNRPANNNSHVASVKDVELHPVVSGTQLAQTPLANKLDYLC